MNYQDLNNIRSRLKKATDHLEEMEKIYAKCKNPESEQFTVNIGGRYVDLQSLYPHDKTKYRIRPGYDMLVLGLQKIFYARVEEAKKHVAKIAEELSAASKELIK